MPAGSLSMHTPRNVYTRDSKRNDVGDMSARRHAGKNDVRESIRATRPIIECQLDVRRKTADFSFSVSDLIEGLRVCVECSVTGALITLKPVSMSVRECQDLYWSNVIGTTVRDDRIDYADETISSIVNSGVTNVDGTLKRRTSGKKGRRRCNKYIWSLSGEKEEESLSKTG